MPTVELTINAGGDVDQLSGAWTDIDEGSSDDGDGTFVEHAVDIGDWRYILGNLDNTGLSGVINHVTVYAKARTTLNSAGFFRTVIKSGAAEDRSATVAFTTGWQVASEQHVVDPNTTLAWTWAAVNALQAGVDLLNETDGKDWATPRCTTVYVVVDYEEPVAAGLEGKSAEMANIMVAQGMI